MLFVQKNRHLSFPSAAKWSEYTAIRTVDKNKNYQIIRTSIMSKARQSPSKFFLFFVFLLSSLFSFFPFLFSQDVFLKQQVNLPSPLHSLLLVWRVVLHSSHRNQSACSALLYDLKKKKKKRIIRQESVKVFWLSSV